MNSPTSRETVQHARNTRPQPRTDDQPASGRDAYADAGMAQRYSRSLLDAANPSGFARRVWEAVAGDLLASWSRLTESRPHLTRDVCRLVGRDPDSNGNRTDVGAALAELRDAGALGYRPASGRDPAVVTLPEPPDEWVDPTCGRTAGELRDARRRAAEARQDNRGGVREHLPEGGSGSTTPTRYEEVGEKNPPTPARHDASTDGPPGGEDDPEREDGQPPAATVLAAITAALPYRLRRSLDTGHRGLRTALDTAAAADVPPDAIARHVLALDADLGPLDTADDLAGVLAYRIRRTLDDPPAATPPAPPRPACDRCHGRPFVDVDADGIARPCPSCTQEATP